MTTQYFRVTAYHPTEDLSIIADSNGKFEKLWQFSSFLVQKGFQIMEVGTDDKFLDVNIEKATAIPDKIIIQANVEGKPIYESYIIDGVSYFAVHVGSKIYIPDRTENKKGERV